MQRAPAETMWFSIGEPAGCSHAPVAAGLDKDRAAWWETIDALLKDYEHRKKLWGEHHEKTQQARQDWIAEKDQYYACQPPESRAHSLSKKISARENKRTEKLNKYSEGEELLRALDMELEEVQGRRQAAIQTLEQLRVQLAELDKDIEAAREERAEVLRQAAQEAQSKPERAVGADSGRGDTQPASADPKFGGEGGQAQFLEASRFIRHMPGFEQFYRLNFPDMGMQQAAREEAAQGDLVGQRKRAAEAPAAAADEMSVSSGDDLFGGGPMQHVSAGARESSLQAVRQARAALVRNDSPGGEAVRQMREGAGGRGRRFDRERSRCRAASREAAQEMSTRAIGRYQEHMRAQMAHAAAAAALVQGEDAPRVEESSRAPAGVESQAEEYTVYDSNEYYQHMG